MTFINCAGPIEGGAPYITGQLLWRVYFYTMSVDNPFCDKMESNPICQKIPWAPLDLTEQFDKWKTGRPAYPLIAAASSTVDYSKYCSRAIWLHNRTRLSPAHDRGGSGGKGECWRDAIDPEKGFTGREDWVFCHWWSFSLQTIEWWGDSPILLVERGVNCH